MPTREVDSYGHALSLGAPEWVVHQLTGAANEAILHCAPQPWKNGIIHLFTLRDKPLPRD
jgi:hypothetical protein